MFIKEIKCLQSFYDTLASECRKAISEFTAVEMDYPNVDAILVKACTPMMRKFCKVRSRTFHGDACGLSFS